METISTGLEATAPIDITMAARDAETREEEEVSNSITRRFTDLDHSDSEEVDQLQSAVGDAEGGLTRWGEDLGITDVSDSDSEMEAQDDDETPLYPADTDSEDNERKRYAEKHTKNPELKEGEFRYHLHTTADSPYYI